MITDFDLYDVAHTREGWTEFEKNFPDLPAFVWAGPMVWLILKRLPCLIQDFSLTGIHAQPDEPRLFP